LHWKKFVCLHLNKDYQLRNVMRRKKLIWWSWDLANFMNDLENKVSRSKILSQSIKIPSNFDTLNFPHHNDFSLRSIIVWCDLNLCKFFFACSALVDYVRNFRYTFHSASQSSKSLVANLSCVQVRLFLSNAIEQMVGIHNSWSFLSCGMMGRNLEWFSHDWESFKDCLAPQFFILICESKIQLEFFFVQVKFLIK
jgi:hypothetical protein